MFEVELAEDQEEIQLTLFTGLCSDPYCNELFAFSVGDKDSKSRCSFCGQVITHRELRSITSLIGRDGEQLYSLLKLIPPRLNSEFTQYRGLSRFVCKLISPLFSEYGIKRNWQLQSLRCLELDPQFNPRLLANRAFFIYFFEFHKISFGGDYESSKYLNDLFVLIRSYFDSATTAAHLIPLSISIYGDNLCQAVSRATIGVEIFWYPLREALKKHLAENESWYLSRMNEFGMQPKEWSLILEECNEDGVGMQRSPKHDCLRIFALANLLTRPIILLNSLENMSSDKESSGVFLPILRNVEECESNNVKHAPLVLAWANKEKSRLVPLVGTKDLELPKLHISVVPSVFMGDRQEMKKYIAFDEKRFCSIACGSSLSIEKVKKMVEVMSQKYEEEYSIPPQLFSDYIESNEDIAGFSMKDESKWRQIIKNKSWKDELYRCMICWRVTVLCKIPEQLLKFEGAIYQSLLKLHGEFKDKQVYSLRPLGKFMFDNNSNEFQAIKVEMILCEVCGSAAGQMREQIFDGRISYENGDHTRTPAMTSLCVRKTKHWWDGEEYDNVPRIIHFEYDGLPAEKVPWFSFESDPAKVTDATKVARDWLRKHSLPERASQELFVSQIAQEILETLDIKTLLIPVNLCKKPYYDLNALRRIPTQSNKQEDLAVFFETYIEKNVMFDLPSYEDKLLKVIDDGDAFKTEQDQVKKPITHTEMMLPGVVKVDFMSSQGKALTHQMPTANTNYDYLLIIIKQVLSISPSDIFAIFYKSESNVQMISRESHLNFKTFDKIYIHLSEKRSKGKALIPLELPNNVQMSLLAQMLKCFDNMLQFWQFVACSPGLFQYSGVIYDFFLIHSLLTDNKHITLAGLLPTITLFYCADENLIKLCIPNVGHFVINEDFRNSLRNYTSPEVEVKYNNSAVCQPIFLDKDPAAYKVVDEECNASELI